MEDDNEFEMKETEDDNSSTKSEALTKSEDVSVKFQKQEGPAIYGNNINGNNWMKDYNKDYPFKLGNREYPTLEHYLQYRR